MSKVILCFLSFLISCSSLSLYKGVQINVFPNSLKFFHNHPKRYAGKYSIEINNKSKTSILLQLSEPNGLPDIQPYYAIVDSCWVKDLTWRGTLDPYYHKTDTLKRGESRSYTVYLNRLSVPKKSCRLTFSTLSYEKLSDVNENSFRNNNNYIYVPIFRDLDSIFNLGSVVSKIDIYSMNKNFLFKELGFKNELCDKCL